MHSESIQNEGVYHSNTALINALSRHDKNPDFSPSFNTFLLAVWNYFMTTEGFHKLPEVEVKKLSSDYLNSLSKEQFLHLNATYFSPIQVANFTYFQLKWLIKRKKIHQIIGNIDSLSPTKLFFLIVGDPINSSTIIKNMSSDSLSKLMRLHDQAPELKIQSKIFEISKSFNRDESESFLEKYPSTGGSRKEFFIDKYFFERYASLSPSPEKKKPEYRIQLRDFI